MSLSERAKNILLRPKEEWVVVAGESTTTAELYRNYIIILAAIGPVASIIGMSLVGISLPFFGTFRVPILNSLASAVVSYLLGLAGVYVLAMIIDYLAPTFAGQKNMNQALKLAAYSFTAGWLASVFVIIPALSILSILGLYGIYLLYTGIPVLMKSPPEKSAGYTAAVIVAAIVIFFIISWIPGRLISYPPMSPKLPAAVNETLKQSQEAATQMQEAAKKLQENAAPTQEQMQQLQEAAKKMQEAVNQAAAKKE